MDDRRSTRRLPISAVLGFSFHVLRRRRFLTYSPPRWSPGSLPAVRRADLAGADPVSAQKHDLGAPDMLLSGVAILANPLKTLSIRGCEVDDYATAHPR